MERWKISLTMDTLITYNGSNQLKTVNEEFFKPWDKKLKGWFLSLFLMNYPMHNIVFRQFVNEESYNNVEFHILYGQNMVLSLLEFAAGLLRTGFFVGPNGECSDGVTINELKDHDLEKYYFFYARLFDIDVIQTNRNDVSLLAIDCLKKTV